MHHCKFILVAHFILALSNAAIAQTDKATKTFAPTQVSVLDVQVLRSTELVRVTSKKTEGNNFPGEIIFPNGKKLSFKNGEYISDMRGTNILTVEPNFTLGNKTLRYYKIENSGTNLAGQLVTEIGDRAFILENEGVLIDNYYELFGNKIELYDKNLRLLNSFTPHTNGYFSCVFKEKNNFITYITCPVDSESLHCITINSENASVLESFFINLSKFNLTTVDIYDNKIVVYGTGKIAVFDKSGNIFWTKNISLPYQQLSFLDNGEKLQAITIDGLTCFSTLTGRNLWTLSLDEIYKSSVFDTYFSSAKSLTQIPKVEVITFDSKIALLIFQIAADSEFHLSPKLNIEFYIINSDGRIQVERKISTKQNFIKMIDNKKQILIASENTVISYAKN